MKHDSFPPTADQFHGTTEVSDAAQSLASVAYELLKYGHGDPLTLRTGAAVLVPAITLGTADYGYRIKGIHPGGATSRAVCRPLCHFR
ncbi:MAG: hypothetical protein ABGZ49_14310 [Akkermansiaceae bacterium]